MNEIEVRQPNEHLRASPALSAILDAVRSSIPLARRDFTPQMVAEARAIASGPVQPASPVVIAAWLKKLALLVVNAPQIAGPACGQVRAMAEICGELPAAVWCPETRKAWCQQGVQGKFWPAPAELYALLRPIADRIAREVEGCKAILAVAAQKPDTQRAPPTEAERKAVAEAMRQVSAERAAREAEEARVRRFGDYMPGNDAALRGWDLIRALEADLPKMTGDMRAFTAERIAVLKVAAEAADALLENAKNG